MTWLRSVSTLVHGPDALLVKATRERLPAVVKCALMMGADVNTTDENGFTALMIAAENADLPTVRFLVSRGAHIRLATPHGWTALHAAAMREPSGECVEVLLGAGADVDATTENGATAFMIAAQSSRHYWVSGMGEPTTHYWHPRTHTMELLLAAGADVNAAWDTGETALIGAAVAGDPETTRFLLGKGADWRKSDRQGKTALAWAKQQSHAQVVELLEAAVSSTDTPTLEQVVAGAATVMTLYVFDSTRISAEVSPEYGTYAQRCLLDAAGDVLGPYGGWQRLAPVAGCHGDLFAADVFGKQTGTVVLAAWIQHEAACVSVHLDDAFRRQLAAGAQRLAFVPYAIGLWPQPLQLSALVHEKLTTSNVVGYLGHISFTENLRFEPVGERLRTTRDAGLAGSDAVFAAVASALCLPVKMAIRDGRCFGWRVTTDDLSRLGLAEWVQ